MNGSYKIIYCHLMFNFIPEHSIMSILMLNFNLFKKILIIYFFTKSFGDETKNFTAITKGFVCSY